MGAGRLRGCPSAGRRLGVRLAFGAGGTEVDQRGAIAAVASVGPVGTLVLVGFVAGLAAFAVWQVSGAVAGFRWVSGGERPRKRIGALAKAVAVVAVAVVAFGTVGVLFADAALHADPGRGGRLNEALRGLAGEWRGIAPLLVLSAGMAPFCGYCLIDSRYRRA